MSALLGSGKTLDDLAELYGVEIRRLGEPDASFRERILSHIPPALPGPTMAEVRAALQPFADCMMYIEPGESDSEWAKFRLTVADYRRAAAVFHQLGGTVMWSDERSAKS